MVMFRTMHVFMVVASASSASPLGKVLELLEGLAKEGDAAKHKEAKEFAEFQAWCADTRTQTAETIKRTDAKMVQLEADIDKAETDSEQLAEEVKELDANIAAKEKERTDVMAIREKEKADYKATHKDLTESVDALKSATTVLKSKDLKVAQATDFSQLTDDPRIPIRAKAVIASFLELGDNSRDMAAPEAAGYEFQSKGIVGLLEKLKLKFEDELTAAEKAEQTASASFETLTAQLEDNIKAWTSSVSEKTAKKADRMSAASSSKGELNVATKSKAADEKILTDTTVNCKVKSQEFEKNQVLRAEELKAIKTAVNLLTSDTVSGTAKRHQVLLQQKVAALADDEDDDDDDENFLQRKVHRSRTMFAQLRSSGIADHSVRERVVELLSRQGHKLGSNYLALIAVRAESDPLAKVKKMIKDLIVKLMEQANAEADNKAFCDSELATNKATRSGKADEVEGIQSAIEQAVADAAQLGEELQQSSEDVAKLQKEVKNAQTLRDADKAKNMQAIQEAKDAQTAVEQASKVLKDYYAKAEGSLLQSADSMDQEMNHAAQDPYKGNQAGGSSIIGFLETLLSDFARLESTTNSAEDSASSEFTQFFNDSSEDLAVKATESEHKSSKKEKTEESIHEMKKELELAQTELDAAIDYYEKLKPNCLDAGLSYEDRVTARTAELESLQEALKMLDGGL